MKRTGHLQEKDAVSLSEEATHLLRTAPAGALLCYLAGTVPFLLAALYFVADMSRSPFAAKRLTVGAITLALLFTVMKCGQAMFARHLIDRLAGLPSARWSVASLARLAATQTFAHALGCLLIPLSILLIFPPGWVYAFFCNITVLGSNPSTHAAQPRDSLMRRAWKQAMLWPGQNHGILFVFQLLYPFVLLNVGLTIAYLPWIAKILFGVESVFTRSPFSLLNTTFFSVCLALAYLVIDPVLKTMYVLRCFYGEALRTGQDLRADLARSQPTDRQRPGAHPAAAMLIGAWLCLAFAPSAIAQTPSEPAPSQTSQPAAKSIAPDRLERSIHEVLQKREYSWRMPRDELPAPSPEEKPGGLGAFLRQIGDALESTLKTVGRWIDDFIQWLNLKPPKTSMPTGAGINWAFAFRSLLVLLIVALAGLVGYLCWKLWKNRKPEGIVQAGVVADQAPPDLHDETVSAQDLPEDEWLVLARDLLQQGDYRLALRAYFLASLAHLADRRLIAIARYKSNLDYLRELGRRGHLEPGMTQAFQDQVRTFERVWYGRHEASQQAVENFAHHLESFRTQPAQP